MTTPFLQQAARILRGGGVVIYPTETFYALGCRADKSAAVEAIYQLKGRSYASPLPLLAASMQQASQVASLPQCPVTRFWPGPLSLLLPAAAGLTERLLNPLGEVALRISASPVARQLARLAGFALTCSSANFSGHAPKRSLAMLDPDLLAALGNLPLPSTVLEGECGPYHAPSSICRLESGRLQILREGAISRSQLVQAGFAT